MVMSYLKLKRHNGRKKQEKVQDGEGYLRMEWGMKGGGDRL
jgi:hypothetical protein